MFGAMPAFDGKGETRHRRPTVPTIPPRADAFAIPKRSVCTLQSNRPPIRSRRDPSLATCRCMSASRAKPPRTAPTGCSTRSGRSLRGFVAKLAAGSPVGVGAERISLIEEKIELPRASRKTAPEEILQRRRLHVRQRWRKPISRATRRLVRWLRR